MENYSWIKVKRYVMDASLSWELRYQQLDKHHVEETSFLIAEVERLKKLLEEKNTGKP